VARLGCDNPGERPLGDRGGPARGLPPDDQCPGRERLVSPLDALLTGRLADAIQARATRYSRKRTVKWTSGSPVGTWTIDLVQVEQKECAMTAEQRRRGGAVL